MSSSVPGPRPRQVTVGGWVIAVASAMLVATVFDTMAGLHSVQTRDAVTSALTTGSARELGLGVGQALGIIRAALFVAGVAAAVTGVLGIFVLQRHAAARVVLTIAAVPVVVTAPFAGGLLGVVIGAATGALWSRPARDWFAGRAPTRPAPATGPPAASTPTPPRRPEPVLPPAADSGGSERPMPRPTPGWGQRPVAAESWPPPYAVAPAYPPRAATQAPVPTTVRVGCVLTWVFSGITAALYLLVGIVLLVDRAGMLNLLRDNPTVRQSDLTEDQLVAAILTVCVVVVVWSLAACGLAVLAWRRRAWAWILLLVSVGFAALVEVVALPFTVVHLVAAGVALRTLLAAPSRAWFRQDGGGQSSGWAPPPGYPSPLPPPPDQQWNQHPGQQSGQQPGQQSGQEPGREPDRDAPAGSGKPPVW